MFLGRYADVLDVTTEAYQRAGFHVVVAMVLHEGLDHLPGLRIQLDLVEYDDAVALVQRHPRGQLELLEEHVEVVGVLLEGRHNVVLGV